MKYTFPAIFTYESDAITVDFPDIEGCFTDGQTVEEAFENAEDVLNLMLMSMEKDHETIPAPTDMRSIKLQPDSFVGMIKADTMAYRKKVDTKAVRKNVSIPNWLNTLAVEHNVNFSNTLQNALMRELNVSG